MYFHSVYNYQHEQTPKNGFPQLTFISICRLLKHIVVLKENLLIYATYLTYKVRFCVVRKLPVLVFIICSRRSWILVSNRLYSEKGVRNREKKEKKKIFTNHAMINLIQKIYLITWKKKKRRNTTASQTQLLCLSKMNYKDKKVISTVINFKKSFQEE